MKCKAITAKGIQCSRKNTSYSKYCSQHHKKEIQINNADKENAVRNYKKISNVTKDIKLLILSYLDLEIAITCCGNDEKAKNILTKTQNNNIFVALHNCQWEIVKHHINNGKILNSSELSLIVKANNLELLKYAISKGSSGTKKLLNIACSKGGLLETVKYLVSIGVKPTPYALSLANNKYRSDIVQYFIELGVVPDPKYYKRGRFG